MVNAREHEGATGLFRTPHGSLLLIPGVAKYLIRGGERMIVDPYPKATDRNVNLYLLGSAFGALLHQRGALPLHANLINVGGAAVAFLGHSGAGKSTLAAWFHDRGYPVLGDDICVVDVREDGAIVYPGIPRLRLWREALERTGRETSNYDMSFDDYEKYDVPTTIKVPENAAKLVAVYDLAKSGSEKSDLYQLKGVNGIETLVANTYRGGFLESSDEVERHLRQCIDLARHVPVFRVERLWGLEHFQHLAETLEAHAISVAAAARHHGATHVTDAEGQT